MENKIYELSYNDQDGTYWTIGFFTTEQEAQEKFNFVKENIYYYTDDNDVDCLEIKERQLNTLEAGSLNYKIIRSETMAQIESELPEEVE